MKYEKPQVARIGEALTAIQSPNVKGGMPNDNQSLTQITVAAYPADE